MQILVDGHCDTVEKALDENVFLDNIMLSFNLKDAKKLKMPIIQVTAAFVSPDYKQPFQRAKEILEYFTYQKEKFNNDIIQITSKENIKQVVKSEKIGCMLAIENGSAIENNLENVDYFYEQGVRMMSITWNEDNLLGSGALTKNDKGLTLFGKQYIQKLNEKNILIDVSHCSEKTFWDTAKISEKNIVASHSNCKALCEHPRNLSDEQIKQIASMNGIIGICYCTEFLSETGKALAKEIAEHIAYIANLVGVDYVGLGSDFDGLENEHIPLDLKGIWQTQNLIQELQKKGFYQNEIDKILGENWLRVFSIILE